MDGNEKGIGLDEALRRCAQSSLRHSGRQPGKDLQFPIETLTVELKVGVTRSKEGKAAFRVPLVEAQSGAGASVHREALQTVTLVLGSPADRQGNPVKVASGSDELKR